MSRSFNHPTQTVSLALPKPLDAIHLSELQRFAELGRLSASLLHEISNPLTAAMLCLEQYDNQQSLFIRQARHNISLLQRYVKAARQQLRQESTVVVFSVQVQVDEVRRILVPLGRSRGVTVSIMITSSCKITGDPVKFQHILANLIINAIDAYGDSIEDYSCQRLVQVRLSCHSPWVIIRVCDKGSGIPSEQLSRIFEPFYTTKVGSNAGLGLGLSLVKQYAEQDFGGQVSARSSSARGTCFTVKLRTAPRQRRQVQAKSERT